MSADQVGRIVCLDGSQKHWPKPFEGWRCSIVAFQHASLATATPDERKTLEELGFRLQPSNVARTRIAGAYAPMLCRAWALTLKGAVEGWPPEVLGGMLRDLTDEKAAKAGAKELLAEKARKTDVSDQRAGSTEDPHTASRRNLRRLVP